MKKALLILLSLVIINSCATKPNNELNLEQKIKTVDVKIVQPKDLYNKDFLVVRDENELIMIDPVSLEIANLYTLKNNEFSLQGGIYEYAVSPSRKYVVWFATNTGFIALDISQQKTWVLEQTNNWINQKPEFEFSENQDKVYWISEGGAVLHEYDLDLRNDTSIPIPYPFGNAFKISDDLNHIIYITGYSSQADRPRFMYSDRTGNIAKTFGSDAELNNRFNIIWTPDNQGTLLIRNGQVVFTSYNQPDQSKVYFENLVNVKDLKRQKDKIFILDGEGYWHKYDFTTNKELARIPTEIVKELKRPAIYPWGENGLLITESMREDNQKFIRLWFSNYRGQKEIIYPRFSQITESGTDVKLD